MSVMNLGGLRGTEATQRVTPRNNTLLFEGVPLDVQQLVDDFAGDLAACLDHHLDSLARAAYRDVVRERSSFTTGLPTALHATGTWGPNDVAVHGGISVGLNENAGAVPRPVAMYAGGEAAFGPVPADIRLWGP